MGQTKIEVIDVGRVVFEIGIVKAVILFIFLFGAGMVTAFFMQGMRSLHTGSKQ